jgi:hypothetical protein
LFQLRCGTSAPGTQQPQEQPSTPPPTTTTAGPMEESTLEALGESLAGNNEWVFNGILVQVRELIDPCSEDTEVDIASTIGLTQVGSRVSFAKTGVSNFRIWLSNLIFEFDFRNKVSNF